MTIAQLTHLKESEDKVEFKEAKNNFPFDGGSHKEQSDRRKCFLGYVVALSNEGGGMLVFGMTDKEPRNVGGSDFANGKIGNLEDEVYKRLNVRVHCQELFDEKGNRVLITHIPTRPPARLMKYEGVALMRPGDSLRNMSDDEMYKILSEQEPDFSAKICDNFSIDKIDVDAINILKEKYAQKQKNKAFLQATPEQVLIDLGLMIDGRLTYAALILLGKSEVLKQLLPNAQVNIEYRNREDQIPFDKRYPIINPLFKAIHEIWEIIQLRNSDNKINQGAYIFDVPYFNEEVIREAVLNAIAHRDYTISSEVVIKQSPESLRVLNPGGFPKGVTLDNLIRINSTPRSRLLTEILEKTGLVERSGQGVDKIYRITLSEGKSEPDYTKSDLFQVELYLNGKMEDKAFHIFIRNFYERVQNEDLLGPHDVIGLFNIKENKSEKVDKEIIQKLEDLQLIKKSGGIASNRYVLNDDYYELKNSKAEVAGFRINDLSIIYTVLNENGIAKMGDFVKAFDKDLTRDQVRYLIEQLTGIVLNKSGEGRATEYSFIKEFKSVDDLINHLAK